MIASMYNKHGLKGKLCETCGEEFWPWRVSTRFCKLECLPSYVKAKPPGKTNCEECGDEFQKRSANHKFCTLECGAIHSRTKSTRRGRWFILERDHFRCAYCGAVAYKYRKKKVEMHVDHIYPKKLGGKAVAGNLITCCQRCNVEKHTTVPRDYKDIQREVSKRNKKIGIADEKPIRLVRRKDDASIYGE